MAQNRVLLVVDSQNLFYALRDLLEKDERLDFLKLREIVCKKTRCSFVMGKIYFSTFREDLTPLVEFLICNGFDVPDPLWKRDVDSSIIVDTLKCCDQFETVVLASGDIDFLPLVQELKKKDKRVGVVSFEGSTSKQLENGADWTIYLDSRIVLNSRKEGGQ